MKGAGSAERVMHKTYEERINFPLVGTIPLVRMWLRFASARLIDLGGFNEPRGVSGSPFLSASWHPWQCRKCTPGIRSNTASGHIIKPLGGRIAYLVMRWVGAPLLRKSSAALLNGL